MPGYLINLTNEQLEALRERSRETGSPVARIVRQGIDMVLSGDAPCSLTVGGATLSGYVALLKVS